MALAWRRSERIVGLLDQAAFAAWSVLLLVGASRALDSRELERFSLVYLALVTTVQVLRPFVAEPLVLIRDPRRPDQLLGGGLTAVAALVAVTIPLVLLGELTDRWQLVAVGVVPLAVLQDSLRSLAAAAGRTMTALVSDVSLVIVFLAIGVLAPDRDIRLSSLLGLVAGALVLSCSCTARAVPGRLIDWSPSNWWRQVRSFAIGATLGGTIDLFVVNGCFALPSLLGHPQVTAALAAGRTLFAAPTTVIGSWLYAWTWQHRDSAVVEPRTAARLFASAVAMTLAWGACALFAGTSVLSELFGGATPALWSMMVPLTLFYVGVTLSVVAKSVLRVVRRPGAARRWSWIGDVCLVSVTLVWAGSSPATLAWALAFALVPLAVGYCITTWRVVHPSHLEPVAPGPLDSTGILANGADALPGA